MEYSANVHEIEHEGKRIVLVGTAHISRESVEEVSRVIEQEQPDAVCIELCAARYEALPSPADTKRAQLRLQLTLSSSLYFPFSLGPYLGLTSALPGLYEAFLEPL